MRIARITHHAVLATLFSTPLYAAGLPDTGLDKCDNGSNVLESCSETNSGDASSMPRQDGRFGRDPATAAGVVTKVGGGKAGFDYTKVANDGSSLASSATLGSGATQWACTRDNLTGLLWEVKTNDNGLRHKDHTYTWFSDANRGDGTANELNGGVAGTENGGTCFNQYDATTNPEGYYCDTAGYVAVINSTHLCGFSDWRVPSKRELETITHLGIGFLAVDKSYFPNPTAFLSWTATTAAVHNTYAWAVYFNYGETGNQRKSIGERVILVRGEGF